MAGRYQRDSRGRGQYYKNKYGGKGRSHCSGPANDDDESDAYMDARNGSSGSVAEWDELRTTLDRINRKSYGAYKDLIGRYAHNGPDFILAVDYVQGDPYASPSRVRAIMPWQETGLSDSFLQSDIRKIALCDFITRVAADLIRSKRLDRNLGDGSSAWSGPKGGAFNINAPGQEVLPRTGAMINGEDTIELRFTVSLPAAGRTILGDQAWQILGVNLVELVRHSLLRANLDQQELSNHVISVENQHSLRTQLSQLGLIAFIANGSILPRASGAAAFPMESSAAVPFQSPPEAEVTMKGPFGACITGMGIPKGITLLTGGGFHGKSTLLEAIQLGIYDHIPGDGRELVVTDPTAVKIRAEDGRSVSSVDISPFISNLPGSRDTKRFSSDDASGSTSMASNIQEALEVGCKTLLIDEDSSATNLLVRDQRMQKLIKNEPISPLISKARALYSQNGVSTVIVIGGLGDWLSISDNIIAMDSYIPRIITNEARAVINEYPALVAEATTYGSIPNRSFQVDFTGFRSPHAKRRNFLMLKPLSRNPVDDPAEAESGIDLSGLDQIVEIGQSRTIASLLQNIANETARQLLNFAALLQALDDTIGIDKCLPVNLRDGDLVAVRRFELAAALSRLRGLFVAG